MKREEEGMGNFFFFINKDSYYQFMIFIPFLFFFCGFMLTNIVRFSHI